jgi:hypothetical protein
MNLDVSLSPYLQDLLTPLQPSLPPELAERLAKSAVGDENTISYDVLLAISQWTRTTPGQLALSAHEPPLRSTNYTMISLLAGCITSPKSKFPEHVSTEDERETEGRRKIAERRAIAGLVNASLSVVGSGVATWWVAGGRGWVVEWVSFGLLRYNVLGFGLTMYTESFAGAWGCACGCTLGRGSVYDLACQDG